MPKTTNQLSSVNPDQARFEREHRRRRRDYGESLFRLGLGNFDYLPEKQRELVQGELESFSDEDKNLVKARVANEYFMSSSMGISLDDVSENYGTYKTGLGGVLGLKDGATDVDLFNAIKSQVDASDKRKEFLHAIATEGYAAGVGKGGKWSDQYNPLYQKLKELDGFDAKQADDYLDTFKNAFERGSEAMAGSHEEFGKAYEYLEDKMGVESREGERWAATDKEIDVLLDSWEIEDIERFTEYAALRAAERGDEKGFLKQSAEALLRGVKMRGREHFRVFERSALNDVIANAKAGRVEVVETGIAQVGLASRLITKFEDISKGDASVLISKAERGLHRLEMAEKFVEVAERVVDPIKAGNWFTEKMWYPFMENISFTAQAMLPGGLGIAGTLSSTYDIRYREMKERHPGLNHEQLSVRAGIDAFIETPMEMLQAKLVFGKLPVTGRLLDKLKGPGAKRFAARMVGGGALGWSEQFFQERGQDVMPLLVGWVADTLSESHPEVDWQKEFDQYADGAMDTFWQVAPLAIVGRAAATFKDFADFQAMAQRQKVLKGAGLSDSWIDKILKATNKDEGVKLLRDAWKERTEEQVKKAFGKLDKESRDEVEKFFERQDDPNRHTVVDNPKGGIDVIAPDGTTVAEGVSMDKGESIIAEAEGEAAESISEDVYEAIETIKMFQRKGASIVGVEEVMNLEEKIVKKLTTPEQAMEAIQEYAQQEGISTEGLTPAQMQILGENELDTSGKIAKAVSRIYQGANPLTPFEETAEGYIKLAVANDELTWENVKGWKNEIEIATGKKTHSDSEEGLTEWFSSTAQGYLLGERKSEEAATYMPSSLIKFLDTMRHMFRAVVKIAADLMRLKKQGKLNKQLEKHLKRSVGLDVGMWEAAAERDMQAQQQEMEAEGMEVTPDVFEIAREIKLPTTHKVLQGELDRLKEALGGMWGQIGSRRATDWDAVVTDFSDRGLNVDSPDDVIELLMQAAEQWRRGKEKRTYSLKEGQETIGRASFPKDAPRLDAENATVVGPTTFSLQAWHGTPHKVRKFLTEKIGMGEGAQVYGWGLYFAEERKVAEHYGKALSSDGFDIIGMFDGKPVRQSDVGTPEGLEGGSFSIFLKIARYGKEGAIQYLKNLDLDKEVLADGLDRVESLSPRIDPPPKGNLYRVNLDVKDEELLLWDNEGAASVLPEADQESMTQWLADYAPDYTLESLDGAELYRFTARAIQQDYIHFEGEASYDEREKLASAYFQSIGIKGIKYADGQSRGKAGDQTFNYVIFDENDIEILEENGERVAAGEAMGTTYSLKEGASRVADLWQRWDLQDGEKYPWMTHSDLADEMDFLVSEGEGTPAMAQAVEAWQDQAASDMEYGYRGESDAEAEALEESLRVAASEAMGTTYSLAVTPEKDAAYMKAVEAGDMEAAQRMVDEAAKAAGFNLDMPLWHRTWSEFNEFKHSDDIKTWEKAGVKRTLRGASGKAFWFGTQPTKEGTPASHNWKQDAKERMIPVYANAKNPLVLDVDTKEWAVEVLGEGMKDFPYLMTDEAVANVQAEGYDSIHLYYGNRTPADGMPNEVILFDPNQVKSSDPVTYDEAGNIIPLSQRFDPSRPEITYAMQINKRIAAIEAKFRERKISERISKGDHKGVEFSGKVKEKTKNLLYKVFPMQEMADEAVAIIDKGMDEAARTFYNDTSGLKPAVRGALGTALARIYNDNGQHDKAADVAIRLAELGTEYGQGVKQFDLLGFAFDSAESVQAFFQRHANTVKKDIKTDPVIGAVRDVAIDIQAEARKLLYQWVNEYLETHGKKAKRAGQKSVNAWAGLTFSLDPKLSHMVDKAAEILENYGAEELARSLEEAYGDRIIPHLKDLTLEALGKVMGDKGVKDEGRKEVKKRVKKRASEKLRNRNIDAPKQAGSALEKILELMDKGEITSAEIDKVFQEKFKIPSMDGDMAKKLADHAKRIGSAPIGSAERRDRVVQMMDFVYDQFEGVKGVDLAWSIWYANILSGHHTHMRNMGDTALQVLADSGFAALFQKHPIEAVSFLFSGFNRGTGAMLGASEAWEHFTSGQQMLGRETVSKFGARSALERFIFAGGKYNPFNWVKFVGRALIAEDGFFFHTAREVKARLVALEMARSEAEKGTSMGEIFDAAETLLNNQSDQIADFEERAKKEWDELDKEGMTVSAEKWQKRRVKELRIQEREGALVERASDFAARATYNYKPEGFIGVLGEMLGRGFKEGTPFGVGRFLVPFVRVPANVTNKALDYTPVGFVRSVFPAVFVGQGKGSYATPLAGEFKKGGSYEMKSADQRAMEFKKGIVGTAAVAALLLRGGSEDDDEGFGIHAAGPLDFNKSKQLRSKGWMPFSVQIGNKYYSYKNTPLSLMFAFVGGVHDAKRYGLYKGDEQSALVQAAYTLADGAAMVLDQSYLSSLSDFFEAMGRQGEARGRALERLIKRTADPTSMIPFSNLAKQITRDLDGYVRDKDDMLGALYSMTPVTTHWNRPKLDALGMPVEQRPISWLWSVEDEGGENHRIWKMIAKKQAFLGSLYSYRHKMDSDQYYEFQKHRGERAREMIVSRLSSLERMSSEDAKKVMRQIGSKSTAYAKRMVKYRESN